MWKRKLIFWGSMGLLAVDILRRPAIKIWERWDLFSWAYREAFSEILNNSEKPLVKTEWDALVEIAGGLLGILSLVVCAIIFISLFIFSLFLIARLFGMTVGNFYRWAHCEDKKKLGYTDRPPV